MFQSSAPLAGVSPQTAELVRTRFVKNVYSWMAGGLMVTAVASLLTMRSPALLSLIFGNQMVFWGLLLSELGLVFWLSARINHMSVKTASWAFLGYSALNGITMSAIFLIYTASSIVATFFVAAGMFAAAAFYGTFTRRDLTSMGSMAFMGLIGIIIASVANWFLAVQWLDWVISYIGVAIFLALSAYDAQKIQHIGYSAAGAGEAQLSRSAIIGALALYLDFVNLFLFLLRIFGQSRD